jgi:hypothetical protein
LWASSIGITILFHTIERIHYLGIKHRSPTLAFLFFIKALLFTFDITSSCIFLYVFLVPLGTGLFKDIPEIPLFLSVIISSPIITTINNAFINLPLVYAHSRVEEITDRTTSIKNTLKKLFSPQVSIFTIVSIYNSVIIIFMMARLELISLQPDPIVIVELLQWNPKRAAVWTIGFNLVINYLIGIATSILYWTGYVVGGFIGSCN